MKHEKKAVWLIQLADLFISRYGYKLVMPSNGPNQESEIWLVNQDGSFPIVRLTVFTLKSDAYDLERLMGYLKAIENDLGISGKALCLHLSEESEQQYDDAIKEVALYPDYISSDDILQFYPELKGILESKEDYDEDYQKAILSIQRSNMRNRKAASKPSLKELPLSYTIILVCIGIFLVSQLFTTRFSDHIVAEILCGAYYKTLILGNYEFYRLLSCGFIHSSFIHLLFNMYALYSIGPSIEKFYSRKIFRITLLASILMGSLTVMAGTDNTVVTGISAGIYGLFGMFVVYTVESGLIRIPSVRNSMISIIAINVLLSLMPDVSVLGHLGGAVCGVLLGFVFSRKDSWQSLKKHGLAALIILAVILVVKIAMNPRYGTIYAGTDSTYIEALKSLDLKWWAGLTGRNLLKYYQKVGF